MDENKKRLTETVNRNFEQGWEIVVRFDHGRSEEAIENGKVMLGKNTGGKADHAEKHIEPELKPRAAGILTPTFFSGLLLCLLLGFIAGALTFRILMLKHGG